MNIIKTLNEAIREIRESGVDARVETLYGAAGEPTIVIVIPGVRLEDGRLIAINGKEGEG